MTFRAYPDTIGARTGKGPADFKRLAADRGFAGPDGIARGVTATRITDWRKADFGLGHGHAMAVVALPKGKPE